MLRPIRLIGSPVLHKKVRFLTAHEIQNPSETIIEDDTSAILTLQEAIDSLHAVLDDFREKNGFGRAIAANQIGLPISVIAARLPVSREDGSFLDVSSSKPNPKNDQKFTFINPLITFQSTEMMELWDDCFSFPRELVWVERHRFIDIEFIDFEQAENSSSVQLQIRKWENVAPALGELLAHEEDHLQGKTSFDRIAPRAAGSSSVVAREVFDADPKHFFREEVEQEEFRSKPKERPEGKILKPTHSDLKEGHFSL